MSSEEVSNRGKEEVLDKIICDLCQTDKDITTKCIDCDEILCKNCSLVHQRIKATRHHKTELVECGAMITSSGVSRHYCDVHFNEEVNLFCITCDKLICTDCVLAVHRLHECVKVKDIAVNKKQELATILCDLKDIKIESIKSKIQQVTEKRQENKNQIKNTTEKIKARTLELVAEIHKVEKELLQKSSELASQNDNQLEFLELELVKDLSTLEKLYDEKSKGIDTVGETEIIKELCDLKSKLENLQIQDSVPAITIFSFDNSEMKNGERKLRDLFGDIETDIYKVSDIESKRSNVNILLTFSKKIENVRSICPVTESLVCIAFHRQYFIDRVDIITKKRKRVKAKFMVTDIVRMSNGDLVVSSYHDFSIKKTKPDFKTTTDLMYTEPLHPCSISATTMGDLLVSMVDEQHYSLTSSSQRRVLRITMAGHITQTMEYNKDGSRLFTRPGSVAENPLTLDVCVLDFTSETSGQLCILDNMGHMKMTYTGGNASEVFAPVNLVCDSKGQIIICDGNKAEVFLLDSNGQFLYYLIKEDKMVRDPSALALDTAGHLWVGCWEGQVSVIDYN